jgi:hypothetical protein
MARTAADTSETRLMRVMAESIRRQDDCLLKRPTPVFRWPLPSNSRALHLKALRKAGHEPTRVAITRYSDFR